MGKFKSDDLGNRIKNNYEWPETERRFLPGLPIIARIDGRGFSKFTKDMGRPYDITMQLCMISTMQYLVKETQALIGYTQSDEITLMWYQEDHSKTIFFDNKIMKLTSVVASMATAGFIQSLIEYGWEDKVSKMPHFDARVFSVPNKIEAVNTILWRQNDATKNAISMAARSFYSHKQLENKNGAQMQEMIFEKGVNFNDYPTAFKRGSFARREVKEMSETYPGIDVMRSYIKVYDLPPLKRISNRVDVIFDDAEPISMD